MNADTHISDLLRGKFELEGFEFATIDSQNTSMQALELECPDIIILDDSKVQISQALFAAFKQHKGLASVPIILLKHGAVADSGVQADIPFVLMPFRPSHLLDLARKQL